MSDRTTHTLHGIEYDGAWFSPVTRVGQGEEYLDFQRYLTDPFPNQGDYTKQHLTFRLDPNLNPVSAYTTFEAGYDGPSGLDEELICGGDDDLTVEEAKALLLFRTADFRQTHAPTGILSATKKEPRQ